jgi:hypothetical protein
MTQPETIQSIMARDQFVYPFGRTFAIKFVKPLLHNDGEANGRWIRVLKQAPEHNSNQVGQLASGLIRSSVQLILTQEVDTSIVRTFSTPDGYVGSRDITVVRYSGELVLGSEEPVNAVGTYIPGESRTGYLHLVDDAYADLLFADNCLARSA